MTKWLKKKANPCALPITHFLTPFVAYIYREFDQPWMTEERFSAN